MVKITVCRSRPGTSFCQLVVSVVGAVLTVEAGSARFGKAAFILSEDETYTLTPSAISRDVEGFLVLDPNGEGRLFVFEHATDGSGIFFDQKNYPTLNFMHQLFSLKVPADAADFDAIDITVNHIVETEDPKPRSADDGS